MVVSDDWLSYPYRFSVVSQIASRQCRGRQSEVWLLARFDCARKQSRNATKRKLKTWCKLTWMYWESERLTLHWWHVPQTVLDIVTISFGQHGQWRLCFLLLTSWCSDDACLCASEKLYTQKMRLRVLTLSLNSFWDRIKVHYQVWIRLSPKQQKYWKADCRMWPKVVEPNLIGINKILGVKIAIWNNPNKANFLLVERVRLGILRVAQKTENVIKVTQSKLKCGSELILFQRSEKWVTGCAILVVVYVA